MIAIIGAAIVLAGIIVTGQWGLRRDIAALGERVGKVELGLVERIGKLESAWASALPDLKWQRKDSSSLNPRLSDADRRLKWNGGQQEYERRLPSPCSL